MGSEIECTAEPVTYSECNGVRNMFYLSPRNSQRCLTAGSTNGVWERLLGGVVL